MYWWWSRPPHRRHRPAVLKGGRGEGVVDSDLGAVLVGDFGGGRDVGDVEQRVGRGLDPHILVVLGGQCGFHGFQIGDVHHVEAHTPRHEHLGEQAVGAAVHIVAEQDVVAGLDGGAQQHVDGGQARGEAQRVLAALPRRRAARRSWCEVGLMEQE